MNTRDILKALADAFDLENTSKRKKALKKALKKLKAKKVDYLERSQQAETDEEHQELKSKLSVIKAQRKKGLAALAKLMDKNAD
jgi:hypothetical protein